MSKDFFTRGLSLGYPHCTNKILKKVRRGSEIQEIMLKKKFFIPLLFVQ